MSVFRDLMIANATGGGGMPIPDDYVFYASLKDKSTTSESGATLAFPRAGSWSADVLDGIPCVVGDTRNVPSSTTAIVTNKVFNKGGLTALHHTLSCWVKDLSGGASRLHGMSLAAGAGGWRQAFASALERDVDGYIPTVFFGGGDTRSTVKVTLGNSWHNFVVTVDDTAIHFYLDGRGVGDAVYSYFANLQNSNMAIAAWEGYPSPFYQAFAAARVYERVLTDAEIKALAHEF